MQPSSDRIDDESKKYLQEVKKGKSRKFVIIKEGVQIDRMYVFKKGPYERFVRIAKQDGVRGEAFWGVVRGDGVDIHFELSRADGFERPPGKDIRLKEFLKEAAGFKFEPSYVIVDASAAVDESEQDETEQDDATENADQEVGQAVPQGGQPDSQAQPPAGSEQDATQELGDKFIRLLKKILPHVKRALAASTSLGDVLQQRVREAQDLGRRREFEQGLATLRSVAELAKQALAEAATSAPNAPAMFPERLQSLRATSQELQATETSVGKEIEARFREAETLAGRKKLDRANDALRQIERLLDLAGAESARRQQWEKRFAQLEPRYNASVHGGASDAETIRTIMDYAKGQAERQQYVKALVGLDRLDPLLNTSA